MECTKSAQKGLYLELLFIISCDDKIVDIYKKVTIDIGISKNK